jgi:hypothetical protein
MQEPSRSYSGNVFIRGTFAERRGWPELAVAGWTAGSNTHAVAPRDGRKMEHKSRTTDPFYSCKQRLDVVVTAVAK